MSDKPLVNSTKPSSALIVGGIYDANPPAPIDGQPVPLQTDSSGNLLVNVVSGGGSNASVGPDGAPAPTSSTQIGSQDGSGNLQPASAANPVPVAVISGGGSNASVGVTGATAPTSATLIGGVGSDGLLYPPDSLLLSEQPTDSERGIVTTSVLHGHTTAGGGSYVDVKVNPSGALAVDASGNTLTDNVAQWGGAAVQAASTASTDGTGAVPSVRTQSRFYGLSLTSTPLGANGVFTSPWIDRNQTGDLTIYATVRADQASASAGFIIQETDDTTDANFIVAITNGIGTTTGVGVSVAANTTVYIFGSPRRRYWRVQYTNGATPQGSFKLFASASPFPLQLFYNNGASSSIGSSNVGVLSLPSTSAVFINDAAPASFTAMGNVCSFNGVFNGATWDRVRTPSIFKTASATASGNTALWTPTTGKKFRLMRFMVQVTGNATTASGVVVTISFQDATTDRGIAMDVFVPSASLGTGDDFVGPWVDLGNGILSAAANNVLNINLSSALTGGNVRVTCCGTEE